MPEPEIQTAKVSVWLRLIEGWNRWTGASVNRSIFGAALTIGALTIAAKLLSVVKELIVAKTFGTSDALDAFLIAFLLPLFAINVVAGSFNTALIPTFIRIREKEGTEAAQRLLSNMLSWSLGLLLVVTLLFALSANTVLPLMTTGFSAEKYALTRKLFFILLPALVICGLSTTWSAVLNAGQKFALAALTPAITPVVTLVTIFALGPSWGIYSVAIGTISGVALEAGVLGAGLKRQGFSLLPRWHGFDASVKEVVGQYAPMIAGALLLSSTVIVDQSMAAMLGPGSVAALSYGYRIVSFVLGIGSLAIGTAVLPYFSRMVAAGDWNRVRHTLKTYARLILLATVPLTLVLVLGSKTIVSLVYERGKFTAVDTLVVSQVQAFYALQIPLYVLGILVVRLISSLRANHILMWGAIISLGLDVSLNLLLMPRLGVAGIGLSNSIVYLVSFCYLLTMLSRHLRRAAVQHG